MTNEQKFKLCLSQAEAVVRSYRDQAPRDFDPQAAVTTTTLLVAAIVVAVVAAGAGSYSAYASAQAQKDAANYNQAVAKNNAATAANQAQYAADRVRERNRRMLGEQRAAMLKSGVTLSGSGQDVAFDSSVQGEMDVLSAIYTGKISQGYSESQARMFGLQKSFADDATYINTAAAGAGSAASSVSSISGMPQFRGNQ
jgi:hypothetical protein